jgi:hypothetical protein
MAGTEGDGVLTLIGGIVLGVVGVVAIGSGVKTAGLVVGWLAALGAAYVAISDFANVSEAGANLTEDTIGAAEVGSGLLLAVIAAVVFDCHRIDPGVAFCPDDDLHPIRREFANRCF